MVELKMSVVLQTQSMSIVTSPLQCRHVQICPKTKAKVGERSQMSPRLNSAAEAPRENQQIF